MRDPDRIDQLRKRRVIWVAYLQHNVDDEEWHGVMDAAADLREIDAELRGLGPENTKPTSG